MEAIISGLEQVSTEASLNVAILEYPESEGLYSLESYFYGTTCISTEGMFDRIKKTYAKAKEKIDKAFDVVTLAINTLLGKIRLLNEEQRRRLALVKEGKMSPEEAQLPVSKSAVVLATKSMLAIAAFLATKALFTKSAKEWYRDAGELDKQRRFAEDYSNNNEDNPEVVAEKAKEKARNTARVALNQLDERQKMYDKAKGDGASAADLAGMEKVLNGLKKKAEEKKKVAGGDINAPDPLQKYNNEAPEKGRKLIVGLGKVVRNGAFMAVAWFSCLWYSVKIAKRLISKCYSWLKGKLSKKKA